MGDSYKEDATKYVKQALEQLGDITPTQLAKRIGVSSSTLTRFLNSENHTYSLSGRTLRLIAKELGENPPVELLDQADASAHTDPDEEEHVIVPEFNADFSAGGGRIATDDNVRRWWPLPRWIVIDTLRIKPDKAAIHEVIGDSMEPTLSSGDFVIIDMMDRRVSNPGIFACWDGDGLVIKRIERVIGSDPPSMRIISDNPRHSSYEVLAENVRIFGRVRWRAQRM